MSEATTAGRGNPHHRRLAEAIDARRAVVGVIGLGYVGLPLAVTAASKGHPVLGFDIDPAKMDRLRAADSYIEAVEDEALKAVVAAGRFDFTTDFARLREAQVIIVCVPTPLTKQREPDLSYVEATARDIAAHVQPGTLVVLESTTFPGTTSEILTPILETSGLKSGEALFVGFSPEREDPGNERYRTATIPKIVAGDGPEAADLVQRFYASVVEKVVPVSTTATAEAVKITENVFRAVNIALVNELKLIYDRMGIDIWEVIDGAATKPFGFMPFYPGPGLGGHCIPIDPFYLTWKARAHEINTRFIELAGEINVAMPRHVVERVRETADRALGRGLKGLKVLIVGIAYKKNVSDMRESPSVRLMELLLEAGAEVAFHDPHVPAIPRMREHPDLYGRWSVGLDGLATGAHELVLIATDHDAIDYAAIVAAGVPIVDTRNAIARRGLDMTLVTKA
ncbi:MAG: nucleotide sugar dehydrogenase [Sphingomonadaceae bacterium]